MNRIMLSLVLVFLMHQTACTQLNFSSTNAGTDEHLQKLDSAILAGKYEQITSVLVAKNGQILYEKYYNGRDQNSKHNTRSATKTMATLLMGIAMQEGHLKSEKEKIYKYLKHKLPAQNQDPRKENITIEDLLTMSSILECNDWNSFSRGNEERMYVIEDWTSFLLDLPIRSYPFEPKPAEQPYGRAFSYCSAGAAAVAEIVQAAVGMKLDQFAKKHLFGPLGIKDYKLDYSPEGTLNTAGGSQYRSRDLLKLGQLCLNEGEWSGQQIIPAAWLKKATSPKARIQEGIDYGYLIWLREFGKENSYKTFYMSGNGGQKVLAIPALEVAVVITTTNYNNRNAHTYTNEMVSDFIIPAMQK
ncbi:MAG: beta-lactamase family protein [Saprospiraceae bacterium]|nr:beta-lactamase family protein [Saprospiraceae bacterium]